jgi:hypothetical protein
MKEKQKIIVAVLGVLFIVLSIPVAIFLVNQRQEIRKEAAKPAEEGGIVKISLSPSQGNLSTSSPLNLSLNLNTEGKIISGVAIKLYYNYSGDEPLIKPVLTENKPFIIPVGLLQNNSFSCPNNSFSFASGLAELSLGCAILSTEGFSSSTNVQLATLAFELLGSPASNSFSINFNPTISMVVDKATNQDILLLPDGDNGTLLGTYTILGLSPTSTPIPTTTPGTGGLEPTSTPTPKPTSTLSATNTPQVTTNTPTPTSSVTTTDDGQDIPVSGIIENTILFLVLGSLLLLFGLALIL